MRLLIKNWLAFYSFYFSFPLFFEVQRWLRKILLGFLDTIILFPAWVEFRVLPKYLVRVVHFFKFHTYLQFNLIADIVGQDRLIQPRFVVSYILLSVRYSIRVRLFSPVGLDDTIPTITGLYAGANWAEREVWDLFGIRFVGHPDLRRILNDYGFDGHPLRKDFPLTGFLEVFYDDLKGRIVYTPVILNQEYRNFTYSYKISL